MHPKRPPKQTRTLMPWYALLAALSLLVLPASAWASECLESGDNPSNPVVLMSTPVGEFCLELLEDAAPGHVENFLAYLDAGDINGTFFHRSVPGFIIQGGGFRAVDGDHEQVPAREGVVVENEPCELDAVTDDLPSVGICSTRGNERGTLAMAKLGGDPDSGTTNWFINLEDNRANLDNQNGGFTVFGRVLGDGMDVVDAIADLEPATVTHLFWRNSDFASAFKDGGGESTLPLVTIPPLDAGSFGCFEAESLTIGVDPTPDYLNPVGDPLNPAEYYVMSGSCGEPIDPDNFEATSAGDGCTYGSALTLAVSVFPDGLYQNPDSEGNLSYFEFSCAAVEEGIAQRTAWEQDFNARFDAELVTIENAVRVPEPCCGPGATLAALFVVAALGRRNRLAETA